MENGHFTSVWMDFMTPLDLSNLTAIICGFVTLPKAFLNYD
jgi:hypothetical protein